MTLFLAIPLVYQIRNKKFKNIKNITTMNTLVKTFALAGLLLTSSVSLFAADGKDLNKAVVENVVDAYINSTVKGETSYLNQLFDNNFVQRFQTEHNQNSISKDAYIKHLKGQKGISFDCDTEYELIEKSANFSIAKVTLEFDSFTRTDYVTMQQGKAGWVIKEVNSVFHNK